MGASSETRVIPTAVPPGRSPRGGTPGAIPPWRPPAAFPRGSRGARHRTDMFPRCATPGAAAHALTLLLGILLFSCLVLVCF